MQLIRKNKSLWRLMIVGLIALMGLMLLAACGETPTESANEAATVPGSPAAIVSLPKLITTTSATPTTTTAANTPTAVTTAPATATPTNQPTSAAPTQTALPSVAPTQTTTAPTTTSTPVAQAPDNSDPADYHPVIWFSASSLAVGAILNVSGSGYPINSKLNVALGLNGNNPAGTYASPQTDGQGRFKGQVKLDHLADGTPFAAGQVVVMVSTADQAVAAGAPITLISQTPTTTVPTTTSAAPATTGKHIDVNLTQQKLVAYDGSKVVYTTLISSGVARHPTVTGTFNIYMKLVKQTMIGGTGAEAYNLPNVPYVMYFYQDYGIHGTYWHHNFGHPMSHGCVNTPTDAAHFLYDWASVGTPVTVHY